MDIVASIILSIDRKIPAASHITFIVMVKVNQVLPGTAAVFAQIQQIQFSIKSTAANQVEGFQNIVGLVAAVTFCIVICSRNKLEGVLSALNQSVKPQINACCIAGTVCCNLLYFQKRVSVI